MAAKNNQPFPFFGSKVSLWRWTGLRRLLGERVIFQKRERACPSSPNWDFAFPFLFSFHVTRGLSKPFLDSKGFAVCLRCEISNKGLIDKHEQTIADNSASETQNSLFLPLFRREISCFQYFSTALCVHQIKFFV